MSWLIAPRSLCGNLRLELLKGFGFLNDQVCTAHYLGLLGEVGLEKGRLVT